MENKIHEADPTIQEDFSSLFARSPEGISIFSPLRSSDGHLIDAQVQKVNPAFCRLYGLADTKTVGKYLSQLFHSGEILSRMFAALEAASKSGKSPTFEIFLSDQNRTLHCQAVRTSSQHVSIISSNEVEQQQREEQMAEVRMKQIATWEWDLDQHSVTCNDLCLEVFGAATDQLLEYDAFMEKIHPEDREMVDKAITRALTEHKTYECEYRIVLASGEQRWIFARGVGIYNHAGKPTHITGVAMDVTRYKQSEEQAVQNAAQVEIQHRLIESRELERMQIAYQLHEGLLQQLIAIKYAIEEGLRIDQKEDRMASLIDVQKILRREIQNLRDYCNDLRPPTLSPFGLEKAIRSHLVNFQNKVERPAVHLDLEADKQRIPEGLRLALFRIYQELLINAVQHAEAEDVFVRFWLEENHAVLEVEDNGKGFEPPLRWLEIARNEQLGLASLLERVEAIGGSIKIDSKTGKGTCMRVTVPLPIL